MNHDHDHALGDLWRHSSHIWRKAYVNQRRSALYSAVPGLCCGIGVFLVDGTPWWLNAMAGATMATSVTVLITAALAIRRERPPFLRAELEAAEKLWDEVEEKE